VLVVVRAKQGRMVRLVRVLVVVVVVHSVGAALELRGRGRVPQRRGVCERRRCRPRTGCGGRGGVQVGRRRPRRGRGRRRHLLGVVRRLRRVVREAVYTSDTQMGAGGDELTWLGLKITQHTTRHTHTRHTTHTHARHTRTRTRARTRRVVLRRIGAVLLWWWLLVVLLLLLLCVLRRSRGAVVARLLLDTPRPTHADVDGELRQDTSRGDWEGGEGHFGGQLRTPG
jgi:hypothetical protein